MNTDDWPTTVAKFRSIFGERQTDGRRWTLRGKNMMTDDVLGYVKVGDELVEISTGWFLDHRVFGVTFNRGNDDGPDDRDQMVESLEDAYALLFGED